MARRYEYLVEDLSTRETGAFATMSAARSFAKSRSIATGHVVAILAVDTRDGSRYAQGAYYGRRWEGGTHHYTSRDRLFTRRR